ncbi:3-deoxy-D-manno-octulosonic acid transferase [Sulfitobacter sp. JB4-11]|uniref:3-deoxy-D-manno-octulosonic acid transferase n=1 Tax=Sulfitobacter rhodophyticola TaxID=3238304 RepID=UPI003516DFCA
MAGSLGLAAYRALVRRSDAPGPDPMGPRPNGEVLWIHAGEPSNMLAIQDLAARLIRSRPGLHVLITLPPDGNAAALTRDDLPLTLTRAPSEHETGVTRFLDHWMPGAVIWVWGGLRPNLILEAAARIPLFLIDADPKGFTRRRDRWLPDMTQTVLNQFTKASARSAEGQTRLEQMGLDRERLLPASALLAGGEPLPCADSDLAELTAALGGRPVWFATQVHGAETATVLAAHAKARRMSHRLLLILQLAKPDDVAPALAATEADFNLALWDEGQFPDENTDVLISEDASDRGLFFRTAPVSFLGSSLVPDSIGCDPLDAAALGSAILYGPKVRHFLPSYTRLAAAGAARIVNDTDGLGTAVSRLIAPDQAATMAHAGWDVISKGAALTDSVSDLVQDALDQSMGRA